jgi:hypothetical protein
VGKVGVEQMSMATIKDAELVIQLSQLYTTEKVGEGIDWQSNRP